MDRNVMLERLRWVATAKPGTYPLPEWLGPSGDWSRGLAELATAALDAIPRWRPTAATSDAKRMGDDMDELITELRERVVMGGRIGHIYDDELERLVGAIPVWRPIAEAPIPPHEAVPTYWIWRCMIQDEEANVYAGFVRYVDAQSRGRSARILRWYEGVPHRYAQIAKPRYFIPLPQPRKDP
jgi:hypothetical protein